MPATAERQPKLLLALGGFSCYSGRDIANHSALTFANVEVP
jgi:hypothetical protein